jgi:hypothetical protein
MAFTLASHPDRPNVANSKALCTSGAEGFFFLAGVLPAPGGFIQTLFKAPIESRHERTNAATGTGTLLGMPSSGGGSRYGQPWRRDTQFSSRIS